MHLLGVMDLYSLDLYSVLVVQLSLQQLTHQRIHYSTQLLVLEYQNVRHLLSLDLDPLLYLV